METPPMFPPGTTTLMESEKCVILTMKFKSRTLWCGTHAYALLNLCYVSECDIVGLILALSSGWAYACHLFLRKNCWAWSSRKCPFLQITGLLLQKVMAWGLYIQLAKHFLKLHHGCLRFWYFFVLSFTVVTQSSCSDMSLAYWGSYITFTNIEFIQ